MLADLAGLVQVGQEEAVWELLMRTGLVPALTSCSRSGRELVSPLLWRSWTKRTIAVVSVFRRDQERLAVLCCVPVPAQNQLQAPGCVRESLQRP